MCDADYNEAVNKSLSSHGNKINEQLPFIPDIHSRVKEIFHEMDLLLKKLITMSLKRVIKEVI